MCRLCEFIDYPIHESQRPCADRSRAAEIRAIRRNSGQDYFESLETIGILQSIIASQKAEIGRVARENEALKSALHPTGSDASRRSFEGIE